jgi:hypothetical protein
MPFDVRKWLKDDLQFTDEELEKALPFFTDTRAAALEKGYLRQSDYSKHMDTLKAEQGKLQQANDRLNKEMADWAELQASGEAPTKKMRADLEKAQQDVLRLTQTVRRVAESAGLDPEQALKDANALPPNPPPAPAAPDLSSFVKQEDYQKQIATLAELSLTLPAELAALSYEHQALYGEPPDTRKIVAEIKARASDRHNQKPLDPRAIWEELYDVPAKRQAKSKAEYDAAIAAAEQRGREAALSEVQLPVGSPSGRHAVVLTDKVRPSESVF